MYCGLQLKHVLYQPCYFRRHIHIQDDHLYCGQACQTGVRLERWQSLAAKLDTFHIFLFVFSTVLWISFGNTLDFFQKYFGFLSEIKFFGFLYQGCEVGVDIEETELRLDRLELTLPLWLCVA